MKRLLTFLVAALVAVIFEPTRTMADAGPSLSPCLKDNSTLCPLVSIAFSLEEDNDRTRFDSVSGQAAFEPDGYSVGRRAGKIGSYGADFAGSDNSYLRVPGIPSLGPGWWTLTAWVYPDTAGSSGQKQTLVANDFKNQTGTHVYLENVSGSLYLKVSVTTAELDTMLIATSGTALTVGAWNFVSVGASSYPNIDGQAVLFAQANNSTKGTTALTYFPRAMNTETYLGARVSQAAGSRTPFDGGLDAVYLFSDALNALQAQNLYFGGTGMGYPFTDPSYTSTITLTINGNGSLNQMGNGDCTAIDDPSSDQFSTYLYIVEGNSGGVLCNLTDPSPGGVVNWVKVHALVAQNGNGSWNNIMGTSCGSEVASYGYATLYTNGSSYSSAATQDRTYANGSTWVDPCGYGTGFVDAVGTWTNNPATGLAWSYSDLVNLQAGASLTTGNPGTAYTLYNNVTQVYVEVSITYN